MKIVKYCRWYLLYAIKCTYKPVAALSNIGSFWQSNKIISSQVDKGTKIATRWQSAFLEVNNVKFGKFAQRSKNSSQSKTSKPQSKWLEI